MAAELAQNHKGKWHPISFFLRKFTEAQRNYSTYEKELQAIYDAIRCFKHYLEERSFHVYTDQKLSHPSQWQKQRSHSEWNFIKTFLFHHCTDFLLQRNRRYQSSYEIKLLQSKIFLFHNCTDFLLQRNRKYQSSNEIKLYKDISVSLLH